MTDAGSFFLTGGRQASGMDNVSGPLSWNPNNALVCVADMPQFCGIADDRVGKGLCCLDHLRVSLSFDLV